MRNIAAGLARFRDSPSALIPITAEGVVAGLLIAFGFLPRTGASAAAGAAFPFDVFFDVKQLLAQTTSWPLFFLFLVLTTVTRASALAATLVLADGTPRAFPRVLPRALTLVAIATAVLMPAAIFMFAGVASRYAPFIWVGAVCGVVPSLLLARAAVRTPTETQAPATRGLPEVAAYLGYAFLIALLGMAMSSLGEIGRLASAAIVVFTAPLHAVIFLGWREHARRGTYPGGGSVAVALTAIAVAVLALGTVYDRYVRELPPVARTPRGGTLLLVGGVDSTLTTGALADIDVRHYGFSESRTRIVSYRGPGRPMTRADTRRDLNDVASAVSQQIQEADMPVSLLGHSQAALIVDRLLDRGLAAPDRSVVLAPPPPFPPPLEIPPPGQNGVGRPGGDVARALAAFLGGVGLTAYDVDTDAFPTNLEPVVLIDSRVPRLAVWTLGDSVWLDRDWRRPGETNVVALTDHVGVANNGRAVANVRAFLAGETLEDDETSWRGAFVGLLRHAFAPWRPAGS